MSSPSRWNWLPPRPDPRDLARESSARSRPCLPAVEQLDDRILLSAAVDPGTGGDGGSDNGDAVPTTGILIGLIKGELNLIKGEVDALKLAESADIFSKDDALKILSNQFLKIDQTLLKYGENLIKGDLASDKQQQELLHKIDESFLKIDQLVPSGENALLPAVQKVREAALDTIRAMGDGSVMPGNDKESKAFLKVADDFLKIDQLLYKFAGNPDAPQFHKGLEPGLKISQEFLKINALISQLDGNLKEQLLPAVQDLQKDTLNFLGTLTKPVGDGGLSSADQTFDGGVTLDDTGDWIE
jgi:hypothetical protein